MSPTAGAGAVERQGGSARGVQRPARMLIIAGLLAAAWLLPIAAQAIRADWLLLVAALLGTGSVLRAGYGLLDRLMLAWILLAGAMITGGLLFSFWPWGLVPVRRPTDRAWHHHGLGHVI